MEQKLNDQTPFNFLKIIKPDLEIRREKKLSVLLYLPTLSKGDNFQLKGDSRVAIIFKIHINNNNNALYFSPAYPEL